MSARAGTTYGYRRTARAALGSTAPPPRTTPMPAAAAQMRWAMSAHAPVSTIVGTVDLPPALGDKSSPPPDNREATAEADNHWRLRLVREGELWRLVAYRIGPDAGLRSRVATVVVERLGDIRTVVERRWGEEPWLHLLASAAPSLRSIAPYLMKLTGPGANRVR